MLMQFEQAPPAPPAIATKSPRCKHALALWTGPLLPEDQYADWADEHRERLTETHAAVAALLGSKLSEQGELEAALALLEPLASQRPLDEHLHRVLIEALAGLGRRWEAIETYERLRDGLDDAYAAEPEPETTGIYRRLLTGATEARARHPSLQPLVGRQQEWKRLLSVLAAGERWQIASVLDQRRGRYRQDAPGRGTSGVGGAARHCHRQDAFLQRRRPSGARAGDRMAAQRRDSPIVEVGWLTYG